MNKHRKSEVQFSDLTTILGIVGGAAVLALFPAEDDTFGAYGIGLAIGFFGYFIVMLLLMAGTKGNFTADYLLDGRRKLPNQKWYVPYLEDPNDSVHYFSDVEN
jgi:hypothetical protein